MYNIKSHIVLKNGLKKMKMLPSFEKKDYGKSKYVIRYEFWLLLQNTKKGIQLEIYPNNTLNNI